MMSPDKRLCAAQPVATAPGEVCYNAPQDRIDDATLLNQLLEFPALWEAISDPNLDMSCDFEEEPDGSSTFANMDMNFNHNFGSYTQDFSQYSDLQFNMLVNENQTPQSEPQDSLSNVVQVKKEEALWGRDGQDHSSTFTHCLCLL